MEIWLFNLKVALPKQTNTSWMGISFRHLPVIKLAHHYISQLHMYMYKQDVGDQSRALVGPHANLSDIWWSNIIKSSLQRSLVKWNHCGLSSGNHCALKMRRKATANAPLPARSTHWKMLTTKEAIEVTSTTDHISSPNHNAVSKLDWQLVRSCHRPPWLTSMCAWRESCMWVIAIKCYFETAAKLEC